MVHTLTIKHIIDIQKKMDESEGKCSGWSLERPIDSFLGILESSDSQEKTATNMPNLVFC